MLENYRPKCPVLHVGRLWLQVRHIRLWPVQLWGVIQQPAEALLLHRLSAARLSAALAGTSASTLAAAALAFAAATLTTARAPSWAAAVACTFHPQPGADHVAAQLAA